MSDLEFVFINRDHDNFVEKVEKNIKNYLPPKYENATVMIQDTIKNNDTRLTGLLIKRPDQNMGPRIYLDNYYKEHLEGTDFEEILKGIAEEIISCEMPNIDVTLMNNYDNIKDKLKIQLCDPELNANNLKQRPHTIIGDFAAMYKVNVFQDENGQGNVPINNSLLKLWNIDANKLHQDALDSPLENNFKLYGMQDIICELMGITDCPENLLEKSKLETTPDEDRMYVLTNDTRTDGSSALLNEKVMEQVGKLLGSCYIIPSSIHECILIPDNGVMKAEELERMIKEVNVEEVLPNEILSYKAQYYDAEFNILENAREYENPIERAMGKRIHRHKPNKGIDR